MISSIVILAFSVLLFLYWFRYTCMLILNTRTTKDYAGTIAAANQLRYREVQESLRAAAASLDGLHDSLERDYRLLSYLLNHAADFQVGGYSLEQRMLRVDYQVMSLWYRCTRSLGEAHARRALEEMSEIVAHFANVMGERASLAVKA